MMNNREFSQRIEQVNDSISWLDIGFSKEQGTVDCPFCLKKNKGYLYPNFFKCFSSRCNAQGNKLHIYRTKNNLSFMEALLELEGKACIDPTTQSEEFVKRDKLLNDVLDAYHDQLMLPAHKQVVDYLLSRGFTMKFIELMRIGYAPSGGSTLSLYSYIDYNALLRHQLTSLKSDFFWNRIIFPIYSENGFLVHLTGRKFPSDGKEDMKWLDSKHIPVIGSSKDYLLFENELKFYKNKDDTLYIVEGVPDAFIMKQLGFSVVGVMGLQKLLKQAPKLQSYDFKKIIAVFDNDRYELDHPYYPGELKSWRVVTNQLIDLQLYLGRSIDVKVCMIPENKYDNVKDINDLYMATNSKQELVDTLKENEEYLIDSLLNKYGGDFSTHRTILKLIASTGKGMQKIKTFIPEDYDPLTYALKVLTT